MINNLVLHAVTNQENINDNFIGFKFIDDKIHFYYPETYDFAPIDNLKEIRKDIMAILNTVKLSKTLEVNSNINNSRSKGAEFALDSYLWIINDYLSRGLYVNVEHVVKLNAKGKVNWKKTLENKPIISNKHLIFKDLYVNQRSVTDNILVEAHKYCIKISIDNIGWLFNLKSDFIELDINIKNKETIFVNEIQKELDKTFDDHKRELLKQMLNVILGLDESLNSNQTSFGTESYEAVYEKMVDKVFSNIKNIREFNPTARWYLSKNEYIPEMSGSSLRPDTVYVDNEKKIAYIIDAKFYRYGTTKDSNNLPEISSIQKQVTYGEFTKNNNLKGVEKVFNAFVLPFNKRLYNTDNNIEYFGYATADWKQSTNEYERVHGLFVDMKYLISVWNRHNNSMIEELIDNINSHLD